MNQQRNEKKATKFTLNFVTVLFPIYISLMIWAIHEDKQRDTIEIYVHFYSLNQRKCGKAVYSFTMDILDRFNMNFTVGLVT